MGQKGFVSLPLLLFVLLFGVISIFYFSINKSNVLRTPPQSSLSNDKTTSSPTISTPTISNRYLSPKAGNNDLSEVNQTDNPNRLLIVNKQAKFQIEFPSNYYIYEKSAVPGTEQTQWDSGDYGKLILCVNKVLEKDNMCLDGLNIYYGLPIYPWGGGCPDNITRIKMLNKIMDVCEDPDGLQTWEIIKHPTGLAEFHFTAVYDKQFTPELAREILQTFSFTE